jgi:hypothetical protein
MFAGTIMQWLQPLQFKRGAFQLLTTVATKRNLHHMQTYKGKGVSMAPEMWQRVQERVEALRPRVSSHSNYVQQLVALDLQYSLIENAPKLARWGKLKED